jgi:hypothetical protein
VPDGAKVKYRHNREHVVRHVDGNMEPIPFPLPRGGSTKCLLALPNGQEIVGEARCSTRDNYSKRLGRDISLGRALAQAERQYPELFKKEVAA